MAILIAGVATLTTRIRMKVKFCLIFWQIFFLCGEIIAGEESEFIQIYRHLLAEWPLNVTVLYQKTEPEYF